MAVKVVIFGQPEIWLDSAWRPPLRTGAKSRYCTLVLPHSLAGSDDLELTLATASK
jgi:hypothetical protein